MANIHGEEVPDNCVILYVVINGRVFNKGAKLPEVDVKTDEGAGTFGYALGTSLERLSNNAVRTFNEVSKGNH